MCGKARKGEGDEKPSELAKEVVLPFLRITTILTFLSNVQEVGESKNIYFISIRSKQARPCLTQIDQVKFAWVSKTRAWKYSIKLKILVMMIYEMMNGVHLIAIII